MSAKILIVEDNANIQLMLKAILTAKNYEVEVASSGIEGHFKLEENEDVKLVICDIMMPKADGYEFLLRTKNIRRERNIPVCMLTAMETKKDIVKSIVYGASDYLIKPIDKELLLEKVSLYLNQGTQNSFAVCPADVTVKHEKHPNPIEVVGVSESEILVDAKQNDYKEGVVMVLESTYINQITGIPFIILRTGNPRAVGDKTCISMSYIGLLESQRANIRKVCIRGEMVTNKVQKTEDIPND